MSVKKSRCIDVGMALENSVKNLSAELKVVSPKRLSAKMRRVICSGITSLLSYQAITTTISLVEMLF